MKTKILKENYISYVPNILSNDIEDYQKKFEYWKSIEKISQKQIL